jgi:hypothetical protein
MAQSNRFQPKNLRDSAASSVSERKDRIPAIRVQVGVICPGIEQRHTGCLSLTNGRPR